MAVVAVQSPDMSECLDAVIFVHIHRPAKLDKLNDASQVCVFEKLASLIQLHSKRATWTQGHTILDAAFTDGLWTCNVANLLPGCLSLQLYWQSPHQ